MKKLLPIAFLAMTMAGCENYKDELEQANRERDSLFMIIDERDSSINEFLDSYNEIQMNLDSIASTGSSINRTMDGEGKLQTSSRERINQNITAINAMLKENREKIADLSRKLKNSSSKNGKLEKMIESLNTRIAEKDQELVELNNRLSAVNANVVQLQTSVDTLTAINTTQSQKITEQTTALHTAYYKVATSRELQDAKIINKEGGLLGIGKSSKLNENIDNSKFTRIDYTQTTTIEVNGEDIKIITAHPVNSYALDKEGKDKVTNLRITDPPLFWSASKYLVIMKQ